MSMPLEVEVVWEDGEVLEIRVAASNQSFAGETYLYIRSGSLEAAAGLLRGFPSRPSDERRLRWPPESADPRLGHAALAFQSDSSGHAMLVADLMSSEQQGVPTGQKVMLKMPFEAAAMDRFVDALQRVGRTRTGVAVLADWA
jgi:hypothetical protein